MPKPHARVMETMRAVDKNGFGQKVLRAGLKKKLSDFSEL
jgi:hypothetical protein